MKSKEKLFKKYGKFLSFHHLKSVLSFPIIESIYLKLWGSSHPNHHLRPFLLEEIEKLEVFELKIDAEGGRVLDDTLADDIIDDAKMIATRVQVHLHFVGKII